MGVVEIKMPRMGESVVEGTILKWFKAEGDSIKEDESLLEVGTDKVDTDIPSPYTGKIITLFAKEGATVEVGKPIASIETDQVSKDNTGLKNETEAHVEKNQQNITKAKPLITAKKNHLKDQPSAIPVTGELINGKSNNGFYSPLVSNIATREGISYGELASIPGTGKDNRLTKKDLFAYIEVRNNSHHPIDNKKTSGTVSSHHTINQSVSPVSSPAKSFSGEHEIIEMDRMRQMIARRMLESKQISPHVTSFVEADVTNIVYWRNRWKQHFKEKEDLALTFTPIFAEAVVKALKDYPMMNVSVDGTSIIVKKDINLGIAVALSDGNLVVPVIHKAGDLNLVGLTQKVNDVAKRARKSKLNADDLQGGTYTISNMGSFGNVMGTPILVQPQVGILALGAVVKKPAVVETPQGDAIGIRHMMMLSHTYDHRVVDGSLGGMFVRRVADYLEKFDLDREV